MIFLFNQAKDVKQPTNNVDQNPPNDYDEDEDESANDYLPPPTRYFVFFNFTKICYKTTFAKIAFYLFDLFIF